MTFAASIALLSGGIALYVAVLSRQLSRAPGWEDLRHFSLAAIAVTGFALLNIPTSAPVLSDHGMVICSRFQIALGALHSYAWIRYSGVVAGRARGRIERVAVAMLAAVALVGVVTPWLLPGGVRIHVVEPLGLQYRTAVSTPAGEGAYALLLLALLVPMARFARAWRAGVASAGIQLVALLVLLLLGVNDALVVAGVYPAPYLVDIAFLVPIATVAYATTRRFVEDARALRALRGDLERQVSERTFELGRAKDALHRAEKLAALGQFAAGVAHEVNNPAAVIAANLGYLAEQEAESLSREGREAVDESVQSIQRLSAIVRQLLDAGRLAAAAERPGSIALRPLGDHAISVARARFGRRVLVFNRIPEALFALGQETVLSQVLVNLVVNAVQAIEPHRSDGRVTIEGAREGARIRLSVSDNGAGMAPEVLRRAFEPFFTTKPFGSGSGLGLAVSRGLIAGLGGELDLESAPGEGTRATVDLPRAEAPDSAEGPADVARGPRLRLLLVDDEAAVLSALRRQLATRFGIEVAGGVDEGLERLSLRPFDLVLCDVMMPAGGGERLYRTLAEQAPAIARRVVFFTGGAVTDAARVFLRNQPQPVLEKPLDVEELARATALLDSQGGEASHH